MIGAGHIGSQHALAISRIPDARLVAVTDPRHDAARALADQWDARACASLDDLLQRDDVAAVLIASPSGLHAGQAVRAARAGKHVITEKPMAITRRGLDEMSAACREADVRLGVIFQNRTTPDVMRTRRALELGLLGQPVLARATMYWRRTGAYYAENGGWRGTWALDGGGALMNQAIHTIDMVQWLTGGVSSVQAITGTLTHPIETEDTAALVLSFANGGIGMVAATTSANGTAPVDIDLVGSDGRITLTDYEITRWDVPTAPEAIPLTAAQARMVAGWQPNEDHSCRHQRLLAEHVRAIRQGEPLPVSGEEGRQAVDVILAAYESAQTGQRVSLPHTSQLPGQDGHG